MAQPVDSSILHEIVRVIEARSKVPERVRIKTKDYQITYLDDHRQRLEEALRRHDPDRLSMLYGQLASKVKYQLMRGRPGHSKMASRAASDRRTPRGQAAAAAPKRRRAAKPARSKRTASRAARG